VNFGAVILAGGNSSRMGRDKARLEIAGQPLLARQIQLAREVGAREIFISGRADRDYSEFDCPVLFDRFPGEGPLAGMERALAAVSSAFLLVLAVDMPNLTPAVLERLLKNGGKGKGVLPRIGRRLEPLAALYPKMAAGLASDLLRHGDHAASAFARCCVESGWVELYPVRARDTHYFVSWNTPRDVPQNVCPDCSK
jgi:molybdopterin-guanine dinucleotide biosynthesis protein A